MRNLIALLFRIVTFPIRLVWRLRKLLVLAGTAAGAYLGWKKQQERQGA